MGDSSKNGEALTKNPKYCTLYKCNLFQQPGWQPACEQRIKRDGLVWALNAYHEQRDDKLGVDICLSVFGIKQGVKLIAEFSFQQPGNQKHTFEHTFDINRNTFFYRRALTIPKIVDDYGNVVSRPDKHHTYYRFLRATEDDEPATMTDDESIEWTPHIPLQWDLLGEMPKCGDTNFTFLSNILAAENFQKSFLYHFTIDSAEISTSSPYRPSICWPKPSKTGCYLNGRRISVDARWFSRWSSFKKFMDNVDLLAPEDFEDLIDILGYYYHGWNLTHSKVMDLVRVAEKFGFYDFPQEVITRGHVDLYFSSMRSTLIASHNHPFFTVVKDKEGKRTHEEMFSVCQKKITGEYDGDPPMLRCFKTKNGMSWIVNLHRKIYTEIEYLCVSLMLNGPYEEDEHQLWRVEFGPSKHSSLGRLPRRDYTRILNKVQRTICFSACYLWEDVVKEMGAAGPFSFHLKTAFTPMASCKQPELFGKTGGHGVTNIEFRCSDGYTIPVNREFIQESCPGIDLRSNDPPETLSCFQLPDCNLTETLHFLDHLYHRSKLYSINVFISALKVARKLNCQPVIEQIERALIRVGKRIEHANFGKRCPLEYLKFNMDMKNMLAIEPLDSYLRSHKEPPVEIFDN